MNNIDIIQYIYVYLLLIAPVAENSSLQPWTPATFWVSHLKITKIAHDNGVIRSLAGRRTQIQHCQHIYLSAKATNNQGAIQPTSSKSKNLWQMAQYHQKNSVIQEELHPS